MTYSVALIQNVKRRSPWMLLVACLCALLVGCNNEAAPPIALGSNVWPGYEPLYLAQAKGLVSEKDLRLIQYPSASEVIRGFRNGLISAAAVTLDEALLMAADGVPIKIILAFDASQGGDVILGHEGVRRVEDLAGRKVGAEASALGAFVLCRAAELHGLDCRRDFTIVNLEFNEHEAAFNAGSIDAVVTFEPVRTRLLKKGAHILFDSREIPNEILDVLVLRTETLKNQPRQVQAIIKGWFAALALMKASPAQTAAIMAQREQLSTAEFTAALAGIHIPDRKENLALLGGNKPGLTQTASNLVRIMVQHGLLPRQINTSDLVDAAPVQTAIR